VFAPTGPPILGSPFFKQRYLLTYFLPSENNGNYIANVHCQAIRLAAGLRPDPLGELKRPQAPSRNEGLLLREEGRVEREGKGSLSLNKAVGCLSPVSRDRIAPL